MKRIFFLMLISYATGVSAQSLNETVMQKALKPWSPLSIKDDGKTIAITLNEDIVTTDIYYLVVEAGVCPPLWFDTKKTGYLTKTKEINILNRSNYSGFVFETPEHSCQEVGSAKGDQGKIVIAGHTHSH